MKYRVVKMLVRARRWANTPKGEQIIVDVLAGMTAVFVLSLMLLTIGIVQEGR